MLQVHARNKPLAEDVDLQVLAQSTPGFTGADLENVINEGALLAARKNRKFITMADLQEAVIKVIAGPEKKSRVVPEHERRLTAYHEAGHAVMHHCLPHVDPVHQVTIIPRGQTGGMTISLPEEDRATTPSATWRRRSLRFWAVGWRRSCSSATSPPALPTIFSGPLPWPGRWSPSTA